MEPNASLRPYVVFGVLLCLDLTATFTSATQFRVGGSDGWTVPADGAAMPYNRWAERVRFQIADSLLFVYQPDKDSVLRVTKEDYETCKTSAPISTFDDGNTVLMFNQSGPYYFISGFQDNCKKNEKMVAVVMADRRKTSPSPPVALPPDGQILVIPAPPSPPSTSAAEVASAMGFLRAPVVVLGTLLFVIAM